MSPGTCGGVSSQLEISHVTSDGVRLEELAPRARRDRATGSGGRASEPVTRFRGAGRPSNRLMRAMWNWARPLHLIHGGASSLWVGLRGVGRDAEPDHDLARWSAPQTGQIAEEYGHGACQEQPSSVPGSWAGTGRPHSQVWSGPRSATRCCWGRSWTRHIPWWSRNEGGQLVLRAGARPAFALVVAFRGRPP
jgi:hypothetical protein